MAMWKRMPGINRCSGLMTVLVFLAAVAGTVAATAQTDADRARQETEAAIATRQDTQQAQDGWSAEKAALVRRYREATAAVQWLTERRTAEEARVAAVEERIAELRRRLSEADRLESSMQDTLAGILLRLEDSVRRSRPFLPEERALRLAAVADELAEPGVTSAEKLRRLLETLQVEAGYATTVEVYQDKIDVAGEPLHADILRLGRLALFWRTPDGDRVGTWDEAAALWVELPGSAKRRIEMAMEMASRMRPVELIDLPLGRIAP